MTLTADTAVVPTRRADLRRLLFAGLSTAAAIALFHQFAYLDIAVSRLFFDPLGCADAGGLPCTYFPAYESKALEKLRFGLQYLHLSAAVILAVWVVRRYAGGARLATPGFAPALAALTTYAVCLGLLINLVLKEHCGRPRPFQTDLFGGQWPFVPAGEISSYCQTNCSFASGEAAGGFWLVCLAMLLPLRWRMAGMLLALVTAVLTSTLRIAFGMHFLSDVLVSWLLTGFIFLASGIALAQIANRSRHAVPDRSQA